MIKKIFMLLVVSSALLGVGCGGSQSDILLEQARFQLDKCNATDPSSLPQCSGAATKAEKILALDPMDSSAALVSSSAHTSLAGLDLLQIVSKVSDLLNHDANNFSQFKDLIDSIETENGHAIDLNELELAKSPLSVLLSNVLEDSTSDQNFGTVNFQAGVLEAADAYLRSVKTAGTGAETVTDIDEGVAATVRDDFLNADSHMVDGGLTDNNLLQPIREDYCRCTLNGGFTAACLRDLMRCALSDTDVPEQDYNLNGSTDRLDCVSLLSPTGLESCRVTDTQ